jgi:nitrite reductase/ring-hydroxylating ferredoxin subunit
MDFLSRLEQAERLDKIVSAGQRAARLIRPGRVRDGLHGVWLGHPLHPVLVQAAAGAWLSASLLDVISPDETAARRLVLTGLAASAPTALAGAVDWSDQHEQQMRVGVVHALANSVAVGCYGASLLSRSPRVSRALRLGGLAALGAGGILGGHLSFRLAGGVNHAEAVPHLVPPGWQHLMVAAELPEDLPVRRMLGEVPVVVIRTSGGLHGGSPDGGDLHVLADRCSHMSGPLSEGDLAGGCLSCPWHGSIFRLRDGSVARGPATAPQPVFETREVAGAIQVRLPGAG